MTTRTLTTLALLLTLGACSDDPAPIASTAGMDEVETIDSDDDDGPEANQVAPPTSVAEAFAAAHPSATDVEWTMEEGGYEASFLEDGQETSIVYAADGTPGAVETEIPVADLPLAVTAALARDHAAHPVTEAARIVTGGVTTYEAEVSINGVSTDLIYAADGTLLETLAAEDD